MLVRLIITFSFIALSGLNAGDGHRDWFYRAWQTKDGLPDNSISGIAQSRDGYLWIGTNAGLIRFNGHEFDPLPLRTLSSLPSRQVRTMFNDRRGSLWLGMERGPVIGIHENDFHVFHRADGLPDKLAMDMTDDPAGRVWIAYANSVFQIDGKDFRYLDADEGIPGGENPCIICDTDGRIWLSNAGKLGRLSDEGFELVEDFKTNQLKIIAGRESGIWLTRDNSLLRIKPGGLPSRIAELPEEAIIHTLYEDSKGAIWIGTQRRGLFRVFRGEVEEVATAHAWIECITEDNEGNIWVGTGGGGLNLIQPRRINFFGKSNGLPFSSVRSTACDDEGRVWAVSRDGDLAYQTENQWHSFVMPDETISATCVTVDVLGQVWVGTGNHGLLKIDGDRTTLFGVPDGLAGPFIRSLLPTSNGDLWIATDEPDRLHLFRAGVISKIPNPVNFSAIRAMVETLDGTIWAGTSDGHLFRIEEDRIIDESAVDGHLDLSIRALHATPDGSLWIGYAGDGLGHLKDGNYHRITTNEGLYDNYISQIKDDGKGFLWIVANRGLFKVDLERLLSVSRPPGPTHPLGCRVFGRSHGLPGIQPSRDYFPAAAQGPRGNLYFSTHSGLLEVRQDKDGENKLPPPVILEKVSLDGETIAAYRAHLLQKQNHNNSLVALDHPHPKLELPPGHDKLTISFAALSFASPENVQARYRLHPIDHEWQEVENQHSVNFSRLPAGKYHFQVIACNNAGVWNETGASLNFKVHPFYWETWWFKMGIGCLTAVIAGGLVFMGLKRKHHRQIREVEATRALEQERSRIARDIHDDLGASLTRISLLSQSPPEQHNEAVNKTFDQIQTTARHLMRSMDGVVWAINPDHDSFDELANYLSSYAQEFLSVANVSCRLEMPMILPDLRLSAQLRHSLLLAFKEALNNTVKYAGATEVRISLKPGNTFFSLTIQDNGSGINPDPRTDPRRPNGGSGLANMEVRMNEIGGSCLLTSTPHEGTTIEFKIPFKAQT